MPPTTRATRRRIPRAEREQQMLVAARRIFAARGFRDASMDEIAAEVGISKPMLYAYFESKEGLFLACSEEAAAQLVAALEESSTHGPADLRLWRGFLAFFGWVQSNRDQWRILYPSGPVRGGPLAPGLAAMRKGMADTLTRLIGDVDCAAGGAVEPLAYCVIAMAEAAAEWWLDHPEETMELQAERLMTFVWPALENLLSGRVWRPPPEGL